jgi:hypothetical protein
MYQQYLVKTIKDHIKPKILKRNNRYKKWQYGYDVEHDVVIVSKDGTIGDVIEIQNLKIALPAIPDNVYAVSDKKENQRWARSEYPKPLAKIKSVFDWERYPVDFKEKWYDYIDEEFKRREEGYWFYNRGVATYITGSHYMFLQWTLYSGKHVKPTSDVMVCAISKTDALVFHSWRHQNLCIKQQYLPTHALGYYQNQGLMLKKCLLTKLYPYQSTIRSFSNPYKTVWTDQRRSSPTGYQRQNSQGVNSTKAKRQRKSMDLTRRSTGRTQVTTRMTVRNSNFSPTTNQVSGSVRITF